jgi:hypothetical protein
VRDLSHANVGIGEQRSRDIKVVFCQLWWTASGAAGAPSGHETRSGALPDQTALEFCECPKHVKDQPSRAVVVSKASVRLRKPIPLSRRVSTVSINCFIDRASRSSFHTMSVSPLRANSSIARR